MDASAVRRRDRGRHALRPRRGRHEGRGRLHDGGSLDYLAARGGKLERLDLVPDHRRRGKHRGQRHRQAAQMGGRARRDASITASWASRAMRRRSATRSRSAGAARSTACWSITGKQGHVAYPQLADNPVRGLVTLMGALMATPLDHGSAHFDPPRISNSPRSTSATRSSTSSRARRARASTSASTIPTARRRSRRWSSAAPPTRRRSDPLAHRLGALERRLVRDQARARSSISSAARSRP